MLVVLNMCGVIIQKSLTNLEIKRLTKSHISDRVLYKPSHLLFFLSQRETSNNDGTLSGPFITVELTSHHHSGSVLFCSSVYLKKMSRDHQCIVLTSSRITDSQNIMSQSPTSCFKCIIAINIMIRKQSPNHNHYY